MITIPLWLPFVLLFVGILLLALAYLVISAFEKCNKQIDKEKEDRHWTGEEMRFDCPAIGTEEWKNLRTPIPPPGDPLHEEAKKYFDTWENLRKQDGPRPNRDGIGSM